MKIRHILTFVSILLLGCSDSEVSENWPELGIVANESGINKQLIAECCFRGAVRKIQVGDFLPGEQLEVAILGQTGILFLDAETLSHLGRLRFVDSSDRTIWFGLNPSIIVNGSSTFAIMQGGGGYGDTGMLSQDGNRIWLFKKLLSTPHMMISADFDYDNNPEFYVSDSSGLYSLNQSGEIIWELPLKVTDIDLYSSQNENEDGLLALDEHGKTIFLIGPEGTMHQEINLNRKIYYFDSIHIRGETLIVTRPSDDSIEVIDLNGKSYFEHAFTRIPVRHGPISTVVRFENTEEPNIAILMNSSSSIGKSLLSIFSLSGELIYQEVLDGGTGIQAIREKLLVGDGTKRVWAYHQ